MDWGLFEVGDGVATTVIDTTVYSLAALKKVGYRFADRCTFGLGEHRDNRIRVTWTFRPGTSPSQSRSVLQGFYQELLDQDLRETIARETHDARSVILAHAFSRTSLVEDK